MKENKDNRDNLEFLRHDNLVDVSQLLIKIQCRIGHSGLVEMTGLLNSAEFVTLLIIV